MIDAQRIDELIAATDSWYGGVPVPAWFDPEPGETVYAVISGVELVELRKGKPPLTGGTSVVDLAATAAMASIAPGVVRSVWVSEPVPARETGAAVVTSTRLVFVGDRSRSWRYSELEDLTHDNVVPETWLAVAGRKRVSGVRYAGAAALQVRFTLALALATERNERPALRAWLLQQRLVVTPARPADVAPMSTPQPPAWLSKTGRGLSLVYLGKRGTSLPLRLAQGAVAALATLLLLGAVLPDAPARRTDVDLSASEERPEKVDEAAQQAEIDRKKSEDEAARRAAEAEAARQAEEAARAAAEEQARLAAAEQARLAAEEQARVAAEQKAAEKRAAADKAAAAEAARIAAEREAATAAAAAPQRQALTSSGGGCMPDYPDFCIPAGPDLDCPDIAGKNFTVLAPDTFRLDGNDSDGVGCESR